MSRPKLSSIKACHLKSVLVQQARGERANLAKAEHGNGPDSIRHYDRPVRISPLVADLIGTTVAPQ